MCCVRFFSPKKLTLYKTEFVQDFTRFTLRNLRLLWMRYLRTVIQYIMQLLKYPKRQSLRSTTQTRDRHVRWIQQSEYQLSIGLREINLCELKWSINIENYVRVNSCTSGNEKYYDSRKRPLVQNLPIHDELSYNKRLLNTQGI